MVVKDNQPQVREDLATIFPPTHRRVGTVAETLDSSYSHIEQHRLHTSDVLVG